MESNREYYVSKEIKDVLKVITSNEKVKKALEFIKNDDENTISEQIEICKIPSPSFKEEEKANYILKKANELGFKNAYIDEAGNVIIKRKGTNDKGPKLVVAAHLDTVFNENTDLNVIKKDGKIYGPSIGDDSRGLAEILCLIRTFNHVNIETIGELIFCTNVGEEGIGNLKGARHLFKENKDIDGFITIDGTGMSTVIYGGTGSHKYKVTYRGPGGHSYLEFGNPSAIHAMGRAIGKIAEVDTPKDPKTTFTVGMVEGGISLNAIAPEASMLVDIRSNNDDELLKLEEKILKIIKDAAKEESDRWEVNKEITVDIEQIGKRPAGNQPYDAPIVQCMCAATEAVGVTPKLSKPASSDANIPIKLGIPALAVGRGGNSGGIHSLGEWYDPKDAYLGPQKVFLQILLLLGIKNETKPFLKVRNNNK